MILSAIVAPVVSAHRAYMPLALAFVSGRVRRGFILGIAIAIGFLAEVGEADLREVAFLPAIVADDLVLFEYTIRGLM